MNIEQECYNAWRRSEGYAVPVGHYSTEQAVERYKQFKKGYMAGVKKCSSKLEILHSQHKKLHSFFLVASKFLRGE